MDLVKDGNRVLYIWGGEVNSNIEKQITELKSIKNVTVNVENIERLGIATYEKSVFDVVLSNLSNSGSGQSYDILAKLIGLVKPKGKLALKDSTPEEQIKLNLKLSGFVNITNGDDNVIICEKPSYDIGSSAKLSFAKKVDKSKISAIWKIDNDEEEEEIINSDELLDEADLEKPDPSSLRVCGTTGKRKACKDCSCGLAEELAEATPKITSAPTQKSSCGSCYLGDAFRCGTCPYMGMPAFKPGEKIQLTDNLMKADV